MEYSFNELQHEIKYQFLIPKRRKKILVKQLKDRKLVTFHKKITLIKDRYNCLCTHSLYVRCTR